MEPDFAPLNEEDVPQNQNPCYAVFIYAIFCLNDIIIQMKKIIFCIFILFILLAGCKKAKTPVVEADSIQISVQATNNDALLDSQNQRWHVTNKKVCIIFGYDFNTPEAVEKFTALLGERYGLENDGGLIYTLIYPDSFKHGARGYASELAADLTGTDKDLAGVLILGAPENTHTAFAKLQDFWEQAVPFPIYALFPQDDVLGLEATCDFVLDKEQVTDLTGDIAPEETVSEIILEAPEVLTDCIDYMLEMEGPFVKDSSLPKHITQMLKNKKIHHYVDPESGIQSINHFVLN